METINSQNPEIERRNVNQTTKEKTEKDEIDRYKAEESGRRRKVRHVKLKKVSNLF